MKKYVNLLLALVAMTGAAQAASKSPFRIFDATAYQQKPDMRGYGIEPIDIVYVSQLWPKWPSGVGIDSLPDSSTLKRLASRLSSHNRPVVVDIEHWPVRGSPETVQNSIRKYRSVLGSLKQLAPSLKLGLYGVLPTVEYHRALEDTGSPKYNSWHAENKKLFAISKDVEYTFPSVYTFNLNQRNWEKYAIAQIREARMYGKPVYVFLWPQYHESNPILGKRYLSYQYWILQLETAFKFADGIVIWGGHKNGGRETWNESADWWLATKDFINKLSNRH